MDVDELDYVVAEEVAQRTGRSLENPEANPKYGSVETVADLVKFFESQPLTRPSDRL
jgi:hypothetical protein